MLCMAMQLPQLANLLAETHEIAGKVKVHMRTKTNLAVTSTATTATVGGNALAHTE